MTATADKANPNPAALPTTDEERLLFYSEVLMANVPTLIADLSSAKYTILSFSGKTREEVKQKQALIQALGRTFTSVLNNMRALQAANKTLDDYETKLVKATPLKFVTSTEALSLSSTSGSGGTAASSAISSDSILILNDEDIVPVREVEAAYEKESTNFAEVSRACNEMEAAFEEAREQCTTMTDHVQRLKGKYEAAYKAWKSAARDRALVAVMRAELKDRRDITLEARQEGRVIEDECGAQELKIIQNSISKKEAELEAETEELKQKQDRYEVELASYQIAYKEQQGAVEVLRDQCKALHEHHRNLELLAKKQQLEETDCNSLRKVMRDTLTFAQTKRGNIEDRQLTADQEAQVTADHPLVALLAARISVLQEQRKTIGGILINARGLGKSDDVTNAIARIQALLEPAIQLDEEALNG